MFGFLFVAAAVLSYVVANSEEQTQHQSLSCGIGGTQKMVMASTFPNHYSNDFNVTIGGTQNLPWAWTTLYMMLSCVCTVMCVLTCVCYHVCRECGLEVPVLPKKVQLSDFSIPTSTSTSTSTSDKDRGREGEGSAARSTSVPAGTVTMDAATACGESVALHYADPK